MTLDGSDSGMMNAEHDFVASSHKVASKARSTLVVALDKPTVQEADQLVEQLGELVEVYKIGLELVLSIDGLAFARRLQGTGKKIFLDMKLLDIPNTVEKSVANVAKLGFDFLTVHGVDRKTLEAAVLGREADKRSKSCRLKLLSVTVLTSNTQLELNEQGTSESPLELVVRRAKMACETGFDGVIASGHEARIVSEATASHPEFIIKVPGIRPANSIVGDQSRVMTPTAAIAAGATYLVIGRPITSAANPSMATRQIINEMESAYRLKASAVGLV